MSHFKDIPATKFDDYEKALVDSIWSDTPTTIQTEAAKKEIENLAKDMLFQTQPE